MNEAAARPIASSPRALECYAALDALASDEGARAQLTARLILAIFDDFYAELCEYPYRAKQAFETIDPQASIRISRERLGLYSAFIAEHGPRIRRACPMLAEDEAVWQAIDAAFQPMIVERYEADIAFSFAHSMRRNICQGEWRPVEYSFSAPSQRRARLRDEAHRRWTVSGRIEAELIVRALRVPGFAVPWRDEAGDARRIADRVNALFDGRTHAPPIALDMLDAGFFRDLSAFVVGRWVLADGGFVPFVVALRNGPGGIYADAVLHRTADVHNLFSSALANFHVTNRLYYQTCVFLFSLMPRRPLGLHYSTIGFNHVGKVAILGEMKEQMLRSGQVFDFSPGFRGTVAIGFTFEACSYHLKIIRDRPTSSYKWGEFVGVEAVLDKYRIVHEINRAGSMLDNVIYYNLKLERDMFSPGLLDELCEQAAGSVQVEGDSVLIRSLIVQLKIVPVPVALEHAGDDEMRQVIVNLGHCIRNNMATNIFNHDLDARNYGVGRYGRVFLFDYDAVEKLTDVKIRTNLDRDPGEEDVPDWFFEPGVVFLPEEIEHGLQLRRYDARRAFRDTAADLLTPAYWQDAQDKLARGEVLALQMYPQDCRLAATR